VDLVRAEVGLHAGCFLLGSDDGEGDAARLWSAERHVEGHRQHDREQQGKPEDGGGTRPRRRHELTTHGCHPAGWIEWTTVLASWNSVSANGPRSLPMPLCL
jgi:hypothetical protein